MNTTIIKSQLKQVPQVNSGDTVKVHQKIKEGDKERIQVFEGIVIAAKHGRGMSGTITVRKVVDGIGVERIFPIHSISISKIEVVKSSKVRRSKLYYLRHTKGKKAKLKMKEFAPAIAEGAAEGEASQVREMEVEEEVIAAPEAKEEK